MTVSDEQEGVRANKPVPWSQRRLARRAAVLEQERSADAQQAVRLTDMDAESLARQARGLAEEESTSEYSALMSDEKIAQIRAEKQEERARVLKAFKDSLLDREYDAYLKGVDNATDRDAKRAYNTRSIVLLLVVLAVVLMPIIAIFTDLSPQDFGSYIAPVTGIAGTVVGYWFGSGERASRS